MPVELKIINSEEPTQLALPLFILGILCVMNCVSRSASNAAPAVAGGNPPIKAARFRAWLTSLGRKQAALLVIGILMIVRGVDNGLDQVVEDEEVRDAGFLATKELLFAEFFLCLEFGSLDEFSVFIWNWNASHERTLDC